MLLSFMVVEVVEGLVCVMLAVLVVLQAHTPNLDLVPHLGPQAIQVEVRVGMVMHL